MLKTLTHTHATLYKIYSIEVYTYIRFNPHNNLIQNIWLRMALYTPTYKYVDNTIQNILFGIVLHTYIQITVS